jgi:curved DNA-binding protein CbpA
MRTDPASAARRTRATIVEFVERAFTVLEEVDYYQILGLPRDATEDAVRAAYYKLATRLHPDVHGDAVEPELHRKLTAVFSRVVEAYRVLASSTDRRGYDEGLAGGERRRSGGVKILAKPEEQIKDASARRFYLLGKQALGAGDAKGAIMNLKVALSLEHSPVIREALTQAETAAGAKPR